MSGEAYEHDGLSVEVIRDHPTLWRTRTFDVVTFLLARLAPVAPGCEAGQGDGLAPAWRVELWAEQIRVAWVAWAEGQTDPKPSWLVPWAKCDKQTKDADRAIARHLLALYGQPPSPRAESRDALEVRWTEANALTVANWIAQAVHLKWNGHGLSLRPVNMGRDDLPWDPRPDIAAMALRAILGEARAGRGEA